ncbi:MAG: YfhO family protein [Candidatus Peregrinibacteria bacterium]
MSYLSPRFLRRYYWNPFWKKTTEITSAISEGWEKVRPVIAPFARHLLFISLLFFIIFLFFFPLLSGERSLQWDTRIFGFPYLFFGAEGLANGHFPLWNERSFSGYPFFGDLENMSFYPGSWIFYSLFAPFGFEAIPYWFLGHFWWGALGAYFLSFAVTKKYFPAFVGAILFSLSGYAIGHLSHLGQETLYSWIPWIFFTLFLAIKRQNILLFLLAGIVLGISFLVGHINTMLSIAFALVLFSLMALFSSLQKNITEPLKTAWKSPAKLFLGLSLTAIFAVGTSALLIFPALELAVQSDRTELSYDQASQMSLYPGDLLQMVFPNLKGVLADQEILRTYTGSVDLTQSYLYIGLFPLFFCFIGFFSTYPLGRFFTITATIFLFLSFGKYTPVHFFFFEHIPGFDKARMAAQFLGFFFFAVSMLSALGMAQIEYSLKGNIARVLFGVFTSVAIVSNIFFFSYGKDFYSEPVPPTGLFHIPREERLFQTIKEEMDTGIPFRIADEKGLFTPNKWMIAGIETVGGNGGIKTKSYSELFPKNRPLVFEPLHWSLYQFLGVRYLFTNEKIPPSLAEKVTIAGYPAYKLKQSLNRAFLVPHFLVTNNSAEQIALLQSGKINFGESVLLEETPIFPPSCASPECPSGEKRISFGNFLQWEIRMPEYMSLRVSSSGNNLLLMSETWYPGWKAVVDGKETPILRANHSFRAIPLSAGVHQVVMKFEPQSFVWGWRVFSGTIFLFFSSVLGYWVWRKISTSELLR